MRRVWIVSHLVDVKFIEHTGAGGNRSLGIAQAVGRRSKKAELETERYRAGKYKRKGRVGRYWET